MSRKTDPRLKVVLSRDPSFIEKVENSSNSFNPGDKIYGRLDFISKKSFQILKMSIFLEGVSRIWVAGSVGNEILLDISKAERKFLSQALDMNSSQFDLPDLSPDGYRCSIEFHFLVSTRIPSADYESPEHCLQLPPSIEMGSVWIDNHARKRYAQPSISYAVRTLITFAGEDVGTTYPVEASVPIFLLPYTKEYPPTDTLDFPAEFILQESRPVKWSLFGGNLGALIISTHEPQPISYGVTATFGVTECQLALEFSPSGNEDPLPALQNMKATIHSLLRIKTFYSVKSFAHLPSQALLSENGKTRMRDEILELKKSKIAHVTWGYKYSSVGSDSGESKSTQELLLKDTTSLSPTPEVTRVPSGKWASRINIPIHIHGRVLPTFCSSLVARVYSIIIRVKVSGIRTEYFDLEVPLQVIHNSPKAILDDDDNLIAHTDDSDIYLDIRRASTTSWFTEDSLETLENPPSYYP